MELCVNLLLLLIKLSGNFDEDWRQTFSYECPYCSACFKEESKSSGLFRRKTPAIKPTSAEPTRVGKLFKKKEIYFVTFEFLNPKYAELFKEANKHILLETLINNFTKEL